MEALAQAHPQSAEPTRRQLGMLLAGFAELGYTKADRAARLSCASDALGLDENLTSFSELTAGQCGYLLGLLRTSQVPDAGAFYAPARIGEGVAPAATTSAPARPGPVSRGASVADMQHFRDLVKQALELCAAVWWILAADAPGLVAAAAILGGPGAGSRRAQEAVCFPTASPRDEVLIRPAH